jgi:hypothetical protein
VSDCWRWAGDIRSLLPSATITHPSFRPTRLAVFIAERPTPAETEHGRSAAPNPTATLSPTTRQFAAAGEAASRVQAAEAPAIMSVTRVILGNL